MCPSQYSVWAHAYPCEMDWKVQLNKETHATRQNTSKVRKRLHQFDNMRTANTHDTVCLYRQSGRYSTFWHHPCPCSCAPTQSLQGCNFKNNRTSDTDALKQTELWLSITQVHRDWRLSPFLNSSFLSPPGSLAI